ncbi:Alpha-crystallin domain-containing protein 22.3 [Capsicum chinense]|nr:Alpha-crystallin domain-containing protein 22.3 [Capsicum chinense]
MVSSSASPATEEWDNVIAYTGSVSLEKAGTLVGSFDVAESMDEYLFCVSLPGVIRDEKVISCEVRPDGRILIKGESATGESMVCKHSMVFKMQTQNLCPPGEFTVSIQLPDGWEKPNIEDREQCSVDSGTRSHWQYGGRVCGKKKQELVEYICSLFVQKVADKPEVTAQSSVEQKTMETTLASEQWKKVSIATHVMQQGPVSGRKHQLGLIEPVTKEEAIKALNDINDSKAPRFDGYNS